MYMLVLTEKNVNLSQIYYVLDFSFFMSQDDAYYHIHQNDPMPPPSETFYQLALIRPLSFTRVLDIPSLSRVSGSETQILQVFILSYTVRMA